MADISSLHLKPLTEEERVSALEPYKDKGEYRRPPAEGKYFLQAPSTVEVLQNGENPKPNTITFTSDKNGHLLVVISGSKIVQTTDAQAKDYLCDRQYLSDARSKFRNGSEMTDYLRAHGITKIPTSDQERVQLIESTAGRIYPAVTQWEGRCGDCDEKKSQRIGMDSFPKDEQGVPKAVVPCKTCKDDVFARLRVKRYVSTVTQGQGVGNAQPVMA